MWHLTYGHCQWLANTFAAALLINGRITYIIAICKMVIRRYAYSINAVLSITYVNRPP